MTKPNAPFGSCPAIKITVRSKRGSPMDGAATRNWPASDTCAGVWAVDGTAALRHSTPASIAANDAVSANIGRFCQAEDTGHLLIGLLTGIACLMRSSPIGREEPGLSKVLSKSSTVPLPEMRNTSVSEPTLSYIAQCTALCADTEQS